MVEIYGIRDGASLKTWLVSQSQETAILIAHRATMRTAPIDFSGVDSHGILQGVSALHAIWPLLCTGTAAAGRNLSELRSTQAGYHEAGLGVAYGSTFAVRVAWDVRDAANAAARAISTSIRPPGVPVMDKGSEEISWEAVRFDCQAILNGKTVLALLQSPLWPQINSAFDTEWREVRQVWQATGPEWQFWIEWYEAALMGRALLGDWDRHWDVLSEIALIAEKDWEAGPERVNGLIAEIQAKHRAIDEILDATPNAEEIVLDAVSGKIKAIPVTQIGGDLRDHIIGTVNNEIIRFHKACASVGSSNFGPVLNDCAATDLEYLQDDLDQNRTYDFGLHESLDICLNSLRRKFDEQGVLDDPAAVRLLRVLERCTLDVFTNSSDVRDLLEKRSDEIYRRISLEHQLQFDQLCADMAADSDEGLRQKMHTDIERAKDETADPELRRRSRHNTLSRVPRGARAIRYSRFEDGRRVVEDAPKPPSDRLWVATILGPAGAELLNRLLGF